MRAPNISNDPVTSTPIRTVSGRSLVHWRLTKRDKRRLALEILAGGVSVTDFTVKQAASLVGLDVEYIRTARNSGNGGNGRRSARCSLVPRRVSEPPRRLSSAPASFGTQ
jgi:hypothetical protein